MRTLHVVVGLIGVYLVYLTFAMQESTEGIWINRIERYWVQFDDRKKSIGESTKVLFSKVADKVSRAFNRVFGSRLVSFRAVGVSGALSFASLFLILSIILEGVCYFISHHPNVLEPRVLQHVSLLIVLGIGFFVVAGFCLILSVLPMFSRSPIWVWLSCAPTLLWLFSTYRVFRNHTGTGRQYGIDIALAISFASDVVLVILIRQSLRRILAHTTLMRIAVAVALQGVALYLAFVTPSLLPIRWHPEMAKTDTGQILFALALFNLPTAVASVAFMVSLLVVVLHRIFWPLLSELTYVLTRNDVLEKRKTVRAIGFACMAYSIGATQTFWYYFSQKVMK